MTIKELYDKLEKLINEGYGDLTVGIRHYECDPRGPEEWEDYEWQNLLDVEVVNDKLKYNNSNNKGLHLHFDDYIDYWY